MVERNDVRKHPLANCEECPLAETGRYVSSGGNAEALLAFVGEAPGVQEIKTGKQFSGPAGKLLDMVLRHHNIRRSDVILTNAVLCRPIDGSSPPRSAMLACRPRLLAELQKVDEVVALGNTAATSLLDETGVMKLRVGPGRPSKFLPDVNVITTIHPAACLRQGDMFPFLVTDVGKVGNTSEPWAAPDYRVVSTPLEALNEIQFLRQGTGPLAVDIEVDIEKDTAFDHPNRYGMLCIGIGYARKRVIVFAAGALDAQVYSELSDLLSNRKIIAQNGKFDLKGLFPKLGRLKLWFDTMLASYVFDERPGIHGLKWQAVERLGAPQYDDAIKSYIAGGKSYANIPSELLYRYNAYDVSCTWDLWEYYEEKFAKPVNADLRRVHDFLVAASNQLMFVELNGLPVDREYLKKLSVEYLKRIDDLEIEINKVLARQGYGPINPRSPQQVKKQLLQYRVRVAGTDAKVLEQVLEMVGATAKYQDVFDFVTLLLLHRREAKLYGTYIKGIAKRMYRGRVYPTFLLHGTTTGRLACRNPNLQNVPRESSIRSLFVPAKSENVFVQTDYSQAELRVLSFLAKDNYFRGIFNAGDRDLFDDLTPLLYPHADKSTMDYAAWKELRIRVKAYVYGLSYGRTEYSIAEEYSIPVEEAREGMAKFFEVIPEIVLYREQTRQRVLDGRYLITPWGRRRRFGLITDENKKEVMNEALAFTPQSTASDMCLQAMTWAREELRGTAYIRNIVHDSILVECAAGDAEDVAGVLDRLMLKSAESIVGDYVRFATESKIGNSWGEV